MGSSRTQDESNTKQNRTEQNNNVKAKAVLKAKCQIEKRQSKQAAAKWQSRRGENRIEEEVGEAHANTNIKLKRRATAVRFELTRVSPLT